MLMARGRQYTVDPLEHQHSRSHGVAFLRSGKYVLGCGQISANDFRVSPEF